MSGSVSTSSVGVVLPNVSLGGGSSKTSIPGVSLPNASPNAIAGTLALGSPLGTLAGAASTPKAPALQAPTALSSTPTPAEANTTAIQAQLASESAAALYGTNLTSGAGLLDQPTTTSRILLGS